MFKLAVVLVLVTGLAAQENLPTDAGVYVHSGTSYTKLKRSCNSGIHSRGLSFGLKDKFTYDGGSAATQVDRHPTFVIVSSDERTRAQVVLLEMIAKKKTREVNFEVGGVMRGVVEIKSKRDGMTTTVTPESDLKSGEYLLGFYEGLNDATIGNYLACGYDFSAK